MKRTSLSLGTLWITVLCAIATGCASQNSGGLTPAETALRQKLAAAPSCCESLAQLPYEPLPAGKAQSVLLDERSPAYAFDTGKSYFVAFRLPDPLKPRELEVSTFRRTGMEPGQGFQFLFFLPQIVLLDESFRITRVTDAAQVHYKEPGFIENGRYRAVLQLNPQRWPERFLIIRTTDAFMRLTFPDLGIANNFSGPPAPSWYEPRSTEDTHFGPTGRLSVELSE